MESPRRFKFIGRHTRLAAAILGFEGIKGLTHGFRSFLPSSPANDLRERFLGRTLRTFEDFVSIL